MIVDADRVAALIAEIAEEEILSRFGALGAGDIATKATPTDFVTIADREAERRLQKALTGIRPGAGFIGEEVAAANPGLVLRLEAESGAFWIVDPLDGTRNFVQGRREFGTIVALVENGEIRQGWIYAIPERSALTASHGDGVSWRGERLKPVAKEGDDRLTGYRAFGSLGGPWKDSLPSRMREIADTEPAACSAYAYIRLARGEKDFALYSRVHPWDHAAGALALREVGGRAAYLDSLEDYAPRQTVGRPLLATASTELWRQIAMRLEPARS